MITEEQLNNMIASAHSTRLDAQEWNAASIDMLVAEVRRLNGVVEGIRAAILRCGPVEHTHACEVHNEARSGCVWACVCGCDDLVVLLEGREAPKTLATLLAGQPSDGSGLGVRFEGEDFESNRMRVKMIDWAQWIKAGWRTSPDVSREDLVRLRDALTEHLDSLGFTGGE